MKDVCKAWANGNLPSTVAHVNTTRPLTQLVKVAEVFVRWQQKRHDADYDVSLSFNRLGALAEVSRAEQAFKLWETVRTDQQAMLFLSALLLQKKWRS